VWASDNGHRISRPRSEFAARNPWGTPGVAPPSNLAEHSRERAINGLPLSDLVRHAKATCKLEVARGSFQDNRKLLMFPIGSNHPTQRSVCPSSGCNQVLTVTMRWYPVHQLCLALREGGQNLVRSSESDARFSRSRWS